MKTAVMYVTHVYNADIERQITKLQKETEGLATMFVMYQEDKVQIEPIEQVRMVSFTIGELNLLGYKTWGCTLMDGNFHFVLLDFYRRFPDYDNYWLVEYDVRFNGNWNRFFSFFDEKDEDFIAAHIETVDDNPDWIRWHEIDLVNIRLGREGLLKSFNPICRFSNRALNLLHERCLMGDNGHNELLMPTLFKYYMLKIADFGGMGRYIYKDRQNMFYMSDPENKEENKCTHRFRPAHNEASMTIPDMIYHPVK